MNPLPDPPAPVHGGFVLRDVAHVDLPAAVAQMCRDRGDCVTGVSELSGREGVHPDNGRLYAVRHLLNFVEAHHVAAARHKRCHQGHQNQKDRAFGHRPNGWTKSSCADR